VLIAAWVDPVGFGKGDNNILIMILRAGLQTARPPRLRTVTCVMQAIGAIQLALRARAQPARGCETGESPRPTRSRRRQYVPRQRPSPTGLAAAGKGEQQVEVRGGTSHFLSKKILWLRQTMSGDHQLISSKFAISFVWVGSSMMFVRGFSP
jgi:hypothetical protein